MDCLYIVPKYRNMGIAVEMMHAIARKAEKGWLRGSGMANARMELECRAFLPTARSTGQWETKILLDNQMINPNSSKGSDPQGRVADRGSGRNGKTTKANTGRLAQRRELLNRFADAWQQRDVEKVMACMSADCLYEASVGPEPGATFKGIHEVRSGILKMFEHDKGSEARISNLFIAGRYAAWEWTYVWRESDGTERLVRGCDVFEFNGTKIRRKSAFRKTPE